MIQGTAHPFRFGGSGGLNRKRGDDKIRQNLMCIVLTTLRERVMRPDLGTVAFTQVLRNVSAPTRTLIQQLVSEAIVRQEPRVQLLAVSVSRRDVPGSGTSTVVEVGYMIPADRQEQTLAITL